MNPLRRTQTGQSDKSERSSDSKDEAAVPASASNLAHHTAIDPLSGVLNHLTDVQLSQLEQFKEKLRKDGWWTPEGPNGRPSHDDGTLLRFLRARKFDITGAIQQFTDTEKWLKEQRVEELYENFDVDSYERARVLYPQWTGRRDRRGIPIYVYVIKDLDSKNVSRYQKESQKYKDSLPNHKDLTTPAKMLPLFALYHNMLSFVLPFVSTLERPNPEVPVTTSTNIVDISGVGLTQFWNLKNHMQDASVLATAHYPETLDRIFVVGAPSFFPTVWGWIKRWFDPVTVSKIFILSKHDVLSTLSKFMDPKDIPTRYGGQLKWEWGQLPDVDQQGRAALERNGGDPNWITGPCLWLDSQRVVVGSEKGQPRRSHSNLDALKPVAYAADYTEHPVHPDRKAKANDRIPDPDTLPANGHAKEPTSASISSPTPSPSRLQQQQQQQPNSTSQPATKPAEEALPVANGTLPTPESNSNPVPVTPSNPPTTTTTQDELTAELEKVGLEEREKSGAGIVSTIAVERVES